MLESVSFRNFTVFERASLCLGPGVNVVIGLSGKTHLLKAIYSTLAASAEGRRSPHRKPSKAALKSRITDKLIRVFRPDALGRLLRRGRGRERCELEFRFADPGLNIDFALATNSKAVDIGRVPQAWMEKPPVYIPTRELLTIYPGFISVYESHYLEFEETWRDTCLLLGVPLVRGPREQTAKELLEPLERAMGGKIQLDRNGRFYLDRPGQGSMEMPLVAEGLRKLGMVARLIATGSLLDKGYLFWDEPETNLNPRLIREVARTIYHVAEHGVQVFIASHSLFLLRELHILAEQAGAASKKLRVFALQPDAGGVRVEQGDSFEQVGAIASLDEELAQSGRYLDLDDR